MLVAATAVVTLGIAYLLYPVFGQAAAALTFAPVALAGALCGVRAGVLVGVAVSLADAALMLPSGTLDPGAAALGQMVLGALGFGMLGLIAGRLRELRERLSEQAATLERELTRRREYMDVLAHELRNPLSAIRAGALAGVADASRLALIRSEAERALELLDSLNDASSIDAGRMRSVLAPTDLGNVVRIVAASTPELSERLRLQVPAAPVIVNADADRLGQVVRNLVSNAAKYSPARAPIELSVGMSSDRRCALVQVRDYGPGIAPAERSQLFERFTRLSTSAATQGSGLGLYISRGIVRDHEGELSAEWPSGGGSLFTVELPLAGR